MTRFAIDRKLLLAELDSIENNGYTVTDVDIKYDKDENIDEFYKKTFNLAHRLTNEPDLQFIKKLADEIRKSTIIKRIEEEILEKKQKEENEENDNQDTE